MGLFFSPPLHLPPGRTGAPFRLSNINPTRCRKGPRPFPPPRPQSSHRNRPLPAPSPPLPCPVDTYRLQRHRDAAPAPRVLRICRVTAASSLTPLQSLSTSSSTPLHFLSRLSLPPPRFFSPHMQNAGLSPASSLSFTFSSLSPCLRRLSRRSHRLQRRPRQDICPRQIPLVTVVTLAPTIHHHEITHLFQRQ
ncbi:hypothetical protein PTE31013_03610 [Pandoraea terrigena]|uniref:Uncharacterized protein n=1 Tax=Pandoraea terrigena TaxID=2508292 RepID=A0A5E4X0W0_9BURK|nr:hypothetical protein PTE31013_03610 [Pandoraea terrigena]